MKIFVSLILVAFVALIPQQSECGINVALNSQSQWSSLANVVLQKLVNANIFDVQMAKNFLTTFGFSGIGPFANLQGSVPYTSQLNFTLGGNATNVANFTDTVGALIASVSSTCSIDRQRAFVEVILKLAIESKVIDIKTAISISTGYGIDLVISDDVNAQECLQKKYDLQRYCATQYNGLTDGLRCFFVANVVSTYENAWDSCRNAGGTLAQILTSSELAVAKTLPGTTNMWVAGRRTKDTTSATCNAAGFYGATYWYEDANFFDSQLVFTNTLVGNNPTTFIAPYINLCNNDNNAIRKCAAVFTNGFRLTGCEEKYAALCQISNDGQEYVLIKDLCSAEAVIATTPATSYKDCIRECRNRRWCRSFNYVNNSCQFFAWSHADNPKTTSANGVCAYYTYFP